MIIRAISSNLVVIDLFFSDLGAIESPCCKITIRLFVVLSILHKGDDAWTRYVEDANTQSCCTKSMFGAVGSNLSRRAQSASLAVQHRNVLLVVVHAFVKYCPVTKHDTICTAYHDIGNSIAIEVIHGDAVPVSQVDASRARLDVVLVLTVRPNTVSPQKFAMPSVRLRPCWVPCLSMG